MLLMIMWTSSKPMVFGSAWPARGIPMIMPWLRSFIKTLKTEEVYLWEYQTLADVKRRLPYFIEQVYNQKRLHSSLGYRPPDEYEEIFLKTKNHSNPSLITLT